MKAIVLYEDQRGPTREFGLHSLVLRCVCDAADGRHDFFQLKRQVQDIPKNGNGNVLGALRRDAADLRCDRLIAVLDDDEVRPLLRLPQQATAAQVTDALRRECNAPEKLSVILLRRNLEDVIDAAASCSEELGIALRGLQGAGAKDRLARDVCLSSLAHDEGRRPLRDCVLGKVPSLRELVDLIGHVLAA